MTKQEQKRLEMYEVLEKYNFTQEDIGLFFVALMDMSYPKATIKQFEAYLMLMKEELKVQTEILEDNNKLN